MVLLPVFELFSRLGFKRLRFFKKLKSKYFNNLYMKTIKKIGGKRKASEVFKRLVQMHNENNHLVIDLSVNDEGKILVSESYSNGVICDIIYHTVSLKNFIKATKEK